jgi:hypothetical protein
LKSDPTDLHCANEFIYYRKTPGKIGIENLNAIEEKDKFVKAPRTWLKTKELALLILT